MTRLIVRSRVGSDGVLRVAIPVGPSEADAEMQLTVESVAKPPQSQLEYEALIDSLAGAWQGDFERPEQGKPEDREPLP